MGLKEGNKMKNKKKKRIFNTAIFDEKPINNFQVLLLLCLILVPYIKWAILGFATFLVLTDGIMHVRKTKQ